MLYTIVNVRIINLISILPVAVIMIVGLLFTFPETSVSQDGATLPYVNSVADVVMSIRPAMLMRSDDYRDLKRKDGEIVDRVVERITDSYFKFSLAEIQEIDQIIYAIAMPDRRSVEPMKEQYNIVVLSTTKDNTTGFEMVTQDVVETFEYEGEEYFQFKKPLNHMYRFAYIADKKTIVWSSSKNGIELSIKAGRKGPQSAEWYKLWQEFSDKPISMAMTVKPEMTSGIPPLLEAFKKVKIFSGGADVARQTKVKAKAVCLQESDARDVVVSVKEALEMGRQALQAQKERSKKRSEDAQIVLTMDLINATKVKSIGKTVEFNSVIKIDFDKLLPMFKESFVSSKRIKAANNLRQVAISFHNFQDAMKKLPSSVMVHESGKKYSWRIAILPYIEEQELYDQYDFTQEWNGPHNREVTSRMPDIFRSDTDDMDSTNTSWFMLDGADGIVNGENALGFSGITDGTSNTILAVEAKRNVHWAKPEDIKVNPDRGLPKFGGFHEGGFHVALADGSIQFVDEKVDPDVLWKMYTATGGEVVNRDELEVDDKSGDRKK